jgi:hypothetical protein
VRLGGYLRDSNGAWAAIPLTPEPPATAIDARFGEWIALDGVTAPQTEAQPGDRVQFTLYWRAVQPVDRDYTVFAHLLDAQGNKVAQRDWQPSDPIGWLPTTSWIVEQPVMDTQTLDLPADLSAGFYRLIVGLYHWQDQQRLPVNGVNGEAGDVVMIATLQVQ